MDYKKHYEALVSRAVGRELEGYSERHHVKPKCIGGDNSPSNLVDLTAEEHYLAHQLLTKMYPLEPKLAVAAACMALRNQHGARSNNKMYGWVRRRAARANSELALTNPAAIAARQKMQAAKIGTKATPEAKANMSAAQLKKPPVTDETRKRISEALKGKPKSAEHVAKVSAALMGKPGTRRGAVLSDETKAKMSAAAIGRKMSPESVAKMVANKTPEQRKAAALKAWETKRRNKEAQNGLQP